jgi:hypothetical protein
VTSNSKDSDSSSTVSHGSSKQIPYKVRNSRLSFDCGWWDLTRIYCRSSVAALDSNLWECDPSRQQKIL